MRGIEALNGIVWGPMGLGLLFGTGLLLTVRTGGFQLRRWGYWMRHTLGAIPVSYTHLTLPTILLV